MVSPNITPATDEQVAVWERWAREKPDTWGAYVLALIARIRQEQSWKVGAWNQNEHQTLCAEEERLNLLAEVERMRPLVEYAIDLADYMPDQHPQLVSMVNDYRYSGLGDAERNADA